MALILSQTTGQANVGSTWVGGVVPGENDYAQAEATHVITITAEWLVKGLYYNGGSYIQEADVIIKDVAGAGIVVTNVNSGGHSSIATAAAPLKIRSSSTNPTKPSNPWTFNVDQIDGTDLRILNFNYIELQGNKYYLGNGHYYAHMNDRTDPDKITVRSVSPPSRDNALVENRIMERPSRVYDGSLGAASIIIAGSCRDDSWFPLVVDEIIKSRQRISFFSQFFHLPHCKIDGKPAFTAKGGRYCDFTITLLEDV